MRERFQSGHSRSAAFPGVLPFLTSLTEPTPEVIPIDLLHPKVMISEMGERQVQRAAALWVYLCDHTSTQNCSTPAATSASCSQTSSQPPFAHRFPGDASKAQLCPEETPTMLSAKARWEHMGPWGCRKG